MSNVNRGYQLRAVLLIVLMSSATAAAQTTESIPDNPPQQAPDTPPEPAGTAWRSLVKETGRDFAARRRSTGVMLAAGGALALAVHPADGYVEQGRMLRLSVRACRQCLRGRVCPRASLRIPCIVARTGGRDVCGDLPARRRSALSQRRGLWRRAGESIGWTIVGRHGRSSYALQRIPVRGGMMVALVREHD